MGQEGDDESLVVAACEAMPILAQALGAEAYAPVFAAQHAEPLLRFLRASQPADVRSAAVGARCASYVLLGLATVTLQLAYMPYTAVGAHDAKLGHLSGLFGLPWGLRRLRSMAHRFTGSVAGRVVLHIQTHDPLYSQARWRTWRAG